MPEASQSSPIIAISSAPSDAEPLAYTELIAETFAKSNWFMSHFGLQNGESGSPVARCDIATGEIGEEVDIIPDLGGGYSGGTGAAGMGHITTSFPFTIPAGVRLSARVRNPGGVSNTFDLGIRLIQ